jgi:aryl-alcohol dehydrogenase-like predicted oxidoreductase
LVFRRKFGWTGVDVPIMGQGTWLIDSEGGGIGRRKDNSLAVKTLQLGLELGMTHIDTAEMYGNGKAEELVGKAIAGAAVDLEDVCFWLARFSTQTPLMKAQ